MDSEITLTMENWRDGDCDETQNGGHVMRRKGCAMQNQGITLTHGGPLVILGASHKWEFRATQGQHMQIG